MSVQAHLNEREIEFLEHYYDCTAMTENLFPVNINAPQIWPNCDRLFLRDYQFAMQNYSYIVADDPLLPPKENFDLKKGAGDCYSIGARNLGKSYILMIDVILSVIHGVTESCVASFSGEKLKKVTEPIGSFIENHKFMKVFRLKSSKKDTVTSSPFKVTTEHGAVVYGVNEQVERPDPGVQFHSKHFKTLWYEETSYSSDEGHKKSIDAEDSLGHIERPSGIPDLCVGSPLGKILQNKDLRNWVWRLPQMVRSDWSEKTEKEKIEFYGGKNHPSFLLNVLAEVTEGTYGFWDMARLREASVKRGGVVKSFEINRETYQGFEERLIVERMAGAEQCYIAADIGYGSAPTEIAVIFYNGKKYRYVYNVTLFRLIAEEQAEIFYWLYKKLGGAFISSDSSGDNGVLIDLLYTKGIPQEHLLKVFLQANIDVDFEKDEDGNIVIDSENNPVMKQENTLLWAMRELEVLFYGGVMELPPDVKFLNQFTNVIAKQSKTRTIFSSKGPDHLHQAMQIFSISRFFNEFSIMKDMRRPEACYGVFNK